MLWESAKLTLKKHGRVYVVLLTGPLQGWHHGKVSDPTDKKLKTTKMGPKEAKRNPFKPDSEYQRWMNSENHSGRALGTRRQSLALSGEASQSQKHKQKHHNHENHRKWTQVARFGLRIRLFEPAGCVYRLHTLPDPKSHREIP